MGRLLGHRETRLQRDVKAWVSRLPITEEQWERSHGDRAHRLILREQRWRLASLAAMVKDARVMGPVLDIGVGYGYSAAALRAALGKAVLLAVVEHPSREILGAASWRSMLHVLDARAVGADAFTLPFRDGTFVAVVAAEILEHLPPERAGESLAEIRRVLRREGLLILTTPNLVRLRNRVAIARGRSPLELPTSQVGSTYGHLREYTVSEVLELLAGAEFERCVAAVVGAAPPQLDSIRSWTLQLGEYVLWRAGWHRVGGYIVASGRKT